MTHPFRRAAIVGVALLPLAASAFIVESARDRSGPHLFDEVLSLVSDRFVDTVSSTALYEKAARGLVRELQDPYAALYSPKELQDFTRMTGGRYGGLGMLVEDQEGTIVVTKVYPHTPAEGAGVHEGDRIVGVDKQSTRGMKLVQVTDLL